VRESCQVVPGVGCVSVFGTRTFRSWSFAITCLSCSMSGPQWHKLVSHRNLTQLGGTIRQVLASNSNGETVHVHGWVKSVRLQKRIAFAMIHDGTTQKGLQVVFRNPTDAKVSVCSPCYARTHTDGFFLISLTNGASVSLKGVLTPSPGPGQNKELVAEAVEVLGACDPEVHRSLTYMF
jgi:asparaginyl-tRNA synthetase